MNLKLIGLLLVIGTLAMVTATSNVDDLFEQEIQVKKNYKLAKYECEGNLSLKVKNNIFIFNL